MYKTHLRSAPSISSHRRNHSIGALVKAIILGVIAALSLVANVQASVPLEPATKAMPFMSAAKISRVPILEYHSIAYDASGSMLYVTPATFDAQLTTLKATGWHTITAGTLATALRLGRSVPAKTFVITFDDGNANNYTDALPILKAHGDVATFFIITSFIVPAGRRPMNNQYLSWPEVRALAAAGMEIGNHTVHHLDEAAFTRAQTDAEVKGAQTMIAAQTGKTPVSFAYPHGATPANLVASVKAAGLQIAVTTHDGMTETYAARFLCPRINVLPTTTAVGLLALIGG